MGGGVASIASSSPVPVIRGSAGSAFVTSATVDLIDTPKATLITKEGIEVDCAPTNFFDIIEALITQASWWLLLLFGAPMLLGWILPGPLQRKKKDA